MKIYGQMVHLKYEKESCQSRGAIFEVYCQTGCGFL
jgi:hypothetical protein